MHDHRPDAPDHPNAVDLPTDEPCVETGSGGTGDEEVRPVLLAEAFQPRGEVHGVTPRVVLQLMGGSEVPHRGRPGVNPNADRDRWDAAWSRHGAPRRTSSSSTKRSIAASTNARIQLARPNSCSSASRVTTRA